MEYILFMLIYSVCAVLAYQYLDLDWGSLDGKRQFAGAALLAVWGPVICAFALVDLQIGWLFGIDEDNNKYS